MYFPLFTSFVYLFIYWYSYTVCTLNQCICYCLFWHHLHFISILSPVTLVLLTIGNPHVVFGCFLPLYKLRSSLKLKYHQHFHECNYRYWSVLLISYTAVHVHELLLMSVFCLLLEGKLGKISSEQMLIGRGFECMLSDGC